MARLVGPSGTWVVHAQSPLTMVASRWTWVPSISANASLLGLAQLRELLGHMRHRTVVLADLHAVDRPAHRRGGGGVPGVGQRGGDAVGGRLDVASGGPSVDARQDGVDAPAGERADGVVAADLAQLAHGRRRPGRRRCARAWPGPRRSAGTAWRAGRGRCAARPPRRWPARHPRRSARRGGGARRPRRCPAARRSGRR